MPWTVRLTQAAEEDYQAIRAWSQQQFGSQQATAYSRQIQSALSELLTGPNHPLLKARPELGANIFTRLTGRHFLVIQVDETSRSLNVLRILHQSMDLPRHVPTEP